MTTVLYAESLNEYIYLKSAQRKLNHYPKTKIKLLDSVLKSKRGDAKKQKRGILIWNRSI